MYNLQSLSHNNYRINSLYLQRTLMILVKMYAINDNDTDLLNIQEDLWFLNSRNDIMYLMVKRFTYLSLLPNIEF